MNVSRLVGTASRILENMHSETLVYRHGGTVPDEGIPDDDVRVSWVTDRLIDDVVEPSRRRYRFHYYLDAGLSGLLAHDGDSWIAYGWIYKPNSREVPYHLPDWLDGYHLYRLYDDRTKEANRRKGWHKHLLAQRLRAIDEHDPDSSIYIDTRADNPSRFSITSAGFEPAGELKTYTLGYHPHKLTTVGWWDREVEHPSLPEPD